MLDSVAVLPAEVLIVEGWVTSFHSSVAFSVRRYKNQAIATVACGSGMPRWAHSGYLMGLLRWPSNRLVARGNGSCSWVLAVSHVNR